MFDDKRSFISRGFLRSVLDLEFRAYRDGDTDAALRAKLTDWSNRLKLPERQAENAFIQTFFADIWGYQESGRGEAGEHTLIPKLRIAGEGAGGGSGEVDLAIGWFKGRKDATPQVLCEFKDIRSALDAKQNRKGSTRSPVEQCLNYVRGARRNLYGNEPVQPWWGLVTDMNEFRLYWWDRGRNEFARFVIKEKDDLFKADYDLLAEGDDAAFDRFLFSRLFHRDTLIAEAGRPPLLRLIEKQWTREEKLEEDFYERYKAVRERLFGVVRLHNPEFKGSPTELLRLTQKLLDRFIFAFYCEDMGQRMLFPPQFIRDYLTDQSKNPYFENEGTEIWSFFKRLFAFMNTGGRFGQTEVPFINGGLFAADAAIDALLLPNFIFVAAQQGANDASLETDRETIFYLSARYNYAARGDVKESVSLYTLGRIFEQSITELEYRAGELEGRDSIAKLSKRKRDGVYYTPEPIVNYLVEETLEPWFAEARREAGISADEAAPAKAALQAYEEKLQAITIVDPACGSGAFLIAAFRRLLEERLKTARALEAASGKVAGVIDETAIVADILSNNLHGVDINPSAVEICKLALWLHTARAKAPLSSLDKTILCGNSLVGADFLRGRTLSPADEERIRPFDWRAAFGHVFARGGFDIVLGNPPYVKLQNLRRVYPDVADYLQDERGDDTYQSARTGNFDLYLPFIEKGLRLLAPRGRMAYIAPSLWAVNEYGEGLRRLVARERTLDRWIDFKAHQVFKEAITYTALQFFTRAANDAVRVAVAPAGEANDIDWTSEELALDYKALDGGDEWLMATGEERALIDRLTRDCKHLDDREVTSGIIVGIQTSADSIYHLRKLGENRYLCTPQSGEPYEVAIEDALMKPLVSGAEAKRYIAPETDTYLLFPYARDERGRMGLIPAAAMAKRFPLAWKHLTQWEKELRGRESGKMDRNEDWWGYVYPKNLDKQDCVKLIVPRLVEHLKAATDNSATIHLDNVDVGGVIPSAAVDADFLTAIINGPVADFIFRRISKPFRGNYWSANKQFIAPLPVPDANNREAAEVARRAASLQTRWTKRRKLLADIDARLGVTPKRRWKIEDLWPDPANALPALIDRAPKAFRVKADRRAWAEAELDKIEAGRVAALQAALDARLRLSAEFADGALRLKSGEADIVGPIFLDDAPGALAGAYWRYLCLSQTWSDAKSLIAALRATPAASEAPAARQFVAKVDALAAENAALATEEAEMNDLLYRLYRLTDDERALVEKDRAAVLPG